MTGFWGMDPRRTRDQGERLRVASGALTTLREGVDAVVVAAAWSGPDADRFRARWGVLGSSPLAALCAELAALSVGLIAEAEQQELASEPEGGLRASTSSHALPDAGVEDGGGAGRCGSARIGQGGAGREGVAGAGPRPAVDVPAADLAGIVSDAIGWGFEHGMDALTRTADRLGLDADGLDRSRGDAEHLGGLLEDWITGERVPTVAELGASTLLAAGSGAVAPVELVTDTGFLDPRTDVTVHAVREVQGPSTPQDLADLVVANDEARRALGAAPGAGRFDPESAGQIRIQTVRAADGTEAFIVHAPPTGGGRLTDPGSWGAQGNSAGWDSNLRSMAGQDSAAMADVRAAMAAAGVPSGADVLFVGHSQGGLTAAQLAADPSFNSAGGAPGTFNITHTFSVGSPVETVVPAQRTTQVVNVAHDPVWGPAPQVAGLPSPGPVLLRIADPVPRLDLDGLRVDGSRVAAPNLREARLDAPQQTHGGPSQLENAHDSVLHTPHGVDPTGGYVGSVRAGTPADPVLSGLQQELTGRYLGEGVTVVADRVVEVGRTDLR